MLAIALLRFPMHMVVAMPMPWILRKLSTCMPQASDVRALAARSNSPPKGMKETPASTTASTATESWRQCRRVPIRMRIRSAIMMPAANASTGRA